MDNNFDNGNVFLMLDKKYNYPIRPNKVRNAV